MHDILEECLPSDAVGQDVAIAVGTDLVPRFLAIPDQPGHALGHPAEAEKRRTRAGPLEEFEKTVDIPLRLQRQPGPLLDDGHAVAVQNVKPVLQLATECTRTGSVCDRFHAIALREKVSSNGPGGCNLIRVRLYLCDPKRP